MHFGLALAEGEIHKTTWFYNLVWFKKQLLFRYCCTDARSTSLKKAISLQAGMNFLLSFAEITFAGEVIFMRIFFFSCSVFDSCHQALAVLILSHEALIGKICLQSFQVELYTIQFGTVINLCFRKIKHWEKMSQAWGWLAEKLVHSTCPCYYWILLLPVVSFHEH